MLQHVATGTPRRLANRAAAVLHASCAIGLRRATPCSPLAAASRATPVRLHLLGMGRAMARHGGQDRSVGRARDLRFKSAETSSIDWRARSVAEQYWWMHEPASRFVRLPYRRQGSVRCFDLHCECCDMLCCVATVDHRDGEAGSTVRLSRATTAMSDARQARRSEDLGRGSALASVLEEVIERRIVLGDLEQVQQLVAVQPPVAPLVPGSPDTRRNAPTRELLAAAHSPQFEWKQPRGRFETRLPEVGSFESGVHPRIQALECAIDHVASARTAALPSSASSCTAPTP